MRRLSGRMTRTGLQLWQKGPWEGEGTSAAGRVLGTFPLFGAGNLSLARCRIKARVGPGGLWGSTEFLARTRTRRWPERWAGRRWRRRTGDFEEENGGGGQSAGRG